MTIRQVITLFIVHLFFLGLSFVGTAHAQSKPEPSCNPYFSSASTILLKEKNKVTFHTLQYSFYPERRRLVGALGDVKAEINYVLGKPQAPLIVMLVGLGSASRVGYARYLMGQLNQMGLSVMSIPSSFHMQSSMAFSKYMRPGLSSQDSEDILRLVSRATSDVTKKHQFDFKIKHLMGISLGGFQAASIMADPKTEGLFNKYILINPPLDLEYGLDVLDKLAEGRFELSEERKNVIKETLKPYLMEFASNVDPVLFSKTLQSNNIGEKELGFFIGLKMSTSVRDVVFASQQVHDDRVLKNKLPTRRFFESHEWKILNYFDQIAWPFYANFFKSGGESKNLDSELSIWKSLLNAPRPKDVLMLHAKDDFISHPLSLELLRAFPIETVLSECGGHVGALSYPVYAEPLKRFLFSGN